MSLDMIGAGTNNNEYHGGISINNAEPEGNMESSIDNNGVTTTGYISCGGIRRLAANDTIRVKIENEGNDADITFSHWSIRVKKIAP